MIKLPIILRGRPDPRDTIGDAMAWLDELTETAKAEQKATGEFIRPVMLLQAEPQSKNNPYTLHAEKLKSHLVEDFRVPDEHVVIATGERKGLKGLICLIRNAASALSSPNRRSKRGGIAPSPMSCVLLPNKNRPARLNNYWGVCCACPAHTESSMRI